ncbi:hypothetical protein DICPUDRAFT_153949 [Dictyostelium purpureum]|uniref:Uncharacterized protein n=1 Tax=Dictyostelium purpureum TaxID=5786 RepID=F0ZQ59_DICPU|nr:uncharacterized protein DICPUDRAFT_153949 [Dictyostelium purpureum]EGC33928.1 hypothetical protein DICPUDRAFT_153949 [Dictyostelium purpureum]|eukprot:XP_003289563.1 hypothetical protein DICPUDRAFT_153949 [Dictyostelium purpureum]
MSRLILFFVLLNCFVLLVSCDCKAKSVCFEKDFQCTNPTLPGFCSQNLYCKNDSNPISSTNVCSDFEKCSSDSNSNTCKNKNLGEFCTQGICQVLTNQPKGGQCYTNENCASNFCNNGVCAQNDKCKKDSECDKNNYCWKAFEMLEVGICTIRIKENEKCEISNSCDLGLTCGNGKCIQPFTGNENDICIPTKKNEPYREFCNYEKNLYCGVVGNTNKCIPYDQSKRKCQLDSDCQTPLEICKCDSTNVKGEGTCVPRINITSQCQKDISSYLTCMKPGGGEFLSYYDYFACSERLCDFQKSCLVNEYEEMDCFSNSQLICPKDISSTNSSTPSPKPSETPETPEPTNSTSPSETPSTTPSPGTKKPVEDSDDNF